MKDIGNGSLYLNLAAEFQIGIQSTDWKSSINDRLVHVIYDDDKTLRPELRRLCALDCEVEVLNVDTLRYGFVMYDKSGARRALKMIGAKPMRPWIRWLTSTGWALDTIGMLTGTLDRQGNPMKVSA